MSSSPHPFPGIRWPALLWLGIWFTVYAIVWGWANFLHICNIAVILTCLGLWLGNRLLISSQALSALVPILFWDLDAGWRLLAGTHLFGGTEYLWDSNFPIAVRLLTLYHVIWPALLLWALHRIGYDRRGLVLQSAIAAVVLTISRFVTPDKNLNFVFADPFLKRSWGPAPIHLGITLGFLIVVTYWPTHLLLRHYFAQPSGARALSWRRRHPGAGKQSDGRPRLP